MCQDSETNYEAARKSVEDLLKTIIATAGIMLALLWGLATHSGAASVIAIIRFASIVLVLSIASALLGLQFIVSQLEKNANRITKQGKVALMFVFAWVSFISGCVLVIVAIFRLAL